jgi:hypothetical protein
MSTLTTSYQDCPIAPIRAETSHERFIDLLRAYLSCPPGTTRAFDDSFGRALGFYDVERGHLHYVLLSVMRGCIPEIRKHGEELGEGWAFEDRPWKRFTTAETRRAFFGSPTLSRRHDPERYADDRVLVWEDES